MNKKFVLLSIVLTVLLLIISAYSLQLSIKEREATNYYLQRTFTNHIESTSHILQELEEEILDEDIEINDEKIRSLISYSNRSLLRTTQSMLNLRLLDTKYRYDTDSLAFFLSKLSEKEKLTANDLENLRKVANFGKKLKNVEKVYYEKSFFYTKAYPTHDIIAILEDLNEFCKNNM